MSGMFQIGNQTACFAAFPSEPFDYALAQGFDAFEWFPDKKPGAGWDESDLTDGARQTIRNTARAHGLRLSVHARWQANLLAPDSASLVWKDLQLACDLGAALLNVHLFHEQGLAAFVEAIVPLIRRTAAAGLQLAIENTPHHAPEHFNELFARLRALESLPTGHVGMCLDPGHANLCAATRNDYLGFCDRLDSQVPIIHLHLHENWGDADTHLPLFTGPAARDDSGIRGLLARLRQRHFSGAVILEQWPHPPSLLNHARDRLLQLWNSGAGGATPPSRSAPVASEQPARPGAPGGDLAAELAAGDSRCRSWREKLDFVSGLLAREDPALTADQLVDIAIYLRFLGTGQLACSEDGRHFRPAHHARLSAQIQERLARLTTPDNAFIVRKIYPWLPSSAPAFQRPEPLTRIRDLAHRNDLSPDLKREIKTTLQNKLHRCAGPEDLATSSALLARITAPGAECSPAFVEQFKIFHGELREFFNARSLDERLAALLPSVDHGQAGLIRLFGQQKGGDGLPDRLAALRSLTALRQGLLAAVARPAPPDHQELLLADIALEDFAFVLLSEIINACESTKPDAAGEFQIGALTLALKTLALSGIDAGETGASEAELQAWGNMSASAGRDDLLRVKATLLRCRRLAEDFSARTVALLAGRVEKLGRALGVAPHAIRVFAESDIRCHNVFQVSKLVASLLRRIRERLGLPGWDVLVAGRAVGRVKTVASLDALERSREGPLLVLLQRAAGDEEVPGHVVGLVLAHELPHLSHLGVRARQAGVVFAACEEVVEFERLQSAEGRMISFLALPDQVCWENAVHPGLAAAETPRRSPKIPAVRLPPESPWLPLERTVPETGGGKAAGARRLAELSRQAEAGFRTPLSLIVPFGVMEAGLDAAPAVNAEYRRWVQRLNGMSPAELAAATPRLRELVQGLGVPDAITAEVARTFGPDRRLIVRSSANCEDLEELAGAGLYESVLNVPPAEVASAIRSVWASLWTRRAALSRREAGLPHEQAHMAVLVQEMLLPDFSFVLHTVNPINHCERELYAEIVVGLGETLASAATRGSPYRVVCRKDADQQTVLAFANFSQASWPDPVTGLQRVTVDYSQVELSRDPGALKRLGWRLATVGRFVEEALPQPQDIEGAVVKGQIYLVQTRPQVGLPPGQRS
jgi:phosphoglucan, water dikinase